MTRKTPTKPDTASVLTCGRAWQAEALEDGRLDPQDRASFERHASGCALCAHELAELRTLRNSLSLIDAPQPTELARLGLRSKILKRANAQFTLGTPRFSKWGAVVALAACVLVLCGIGWRFFPRSQHRFEVADVANAVWRVESRGDTTRLALDAGTAVFQVQRVAPGAR